MSHKCFLYLDYNALGLKFVIAAFCRAGYSAVPYAFSLEDADETDGAKKEEGAKRLLLELQGGKYDFLFSLNFFAVPALVCKALGIRYISWVYDSPFLQLYSEAVLFDTNIILGFDSSDVRLLQKRRANAYYLPLAAETDAYEKIILNAPYTLRKRYSSEVSFVGSLYTSRYGVFDEITKAQEADGYIKGFLNALIKASGLVYGADILEMALPDDLALKINDMTKIVGGESRIKVIKWIIANAYLARRVTQNERVEIMSMLGGLNDIDSALYTDSPFTPTGRLRLMPPIDYSTAAPIAFANTKINLNITLRSIKSGIPLRAFDIMACKGFLISNYQSDFLDLFEPDVDFVYYESLGHLSELINFYAKNEDAAKKIKDSAYEKVKRFHSYDERIKEILEFVKLN